MRAIREKRSALKSFWAGFGVGVGIGALAAMLAVITFWILF